MKKVKRAFEARVRKMRERERIKAAEAAKQKNAPSPRVEIGDNKAIPRRRTVKKKRGVGYVKNY